MSVDLSDYVDNLKREVNPPGVTIFGDATDTDYEGYLADSFWEMTLRGYVSGYTADDTIVTPDSGTTELERQLIQLIIIDAALRIMRVHLANIDTGFRAHAGPVEYETKKSAQAIQAALAALTTRFDDIIEYLPTDIEGNPIYYGDVGSLRTYAASGNYSNPWWVGY